MPIAAATSPSGLSAAAWAICRSDGKGIGRLRVESRDRGSRSYAVTRRRSRSSTSNRPSRMSHAHAAVARERAEREEVHGPQQAVGVGGHGGREAEQGGVGMVDGRGRELEHAAGLLPEHLQRRAHAAPQAEPQQAGGRGEAGQPDVHGHVDAHGPDPALPGDDRLGCERELGDEVQVEAALRGRCGTSRPAPGTARRPRRRDGPPDGPRSRRGRCRRPPGRPESRICAASWNSPTGVASDPARTSRSSTPAAVRSASMRRSAARSGTARAARCGTGRIPASRTDRATATVCSHGVFGRNVRYTAVPAGRTSGSGGSVGASRGVISTLNRAVSPRSTAPTASSPGRRPRPSLGAKSMAQPRRRRISALIAGTTSCMSPITA